MAAVGRLNMDGAGFCTGALIAPDQVLTAAHCVFDPETGEELAAERVHFFAGRRGNRSAAFRNAKAIYVHPEYDFGGMGKLQRVAADLAIVELSRPLRALTAVPFDLGERAIKGQSVMVTAYADEHATHVDLQDDCTILQTENDVFLLSCFVTNGASGAPVFIEQDGLLQLVGVISAKAQWQDKSVALAADITDALSPLIASMNGS